jgi:hypothetical protein
MDNYKTDLDLNYTTDIDTVELSDIEEALKSSKNRKVSGPD